MKRNTIPVEKLAELRVQHERWLRFDSGASPGQVADSSTIVELLDYIDVLRESSKRVYDAMLHAIHLGYFGEGSTQGMMKEALGSLKEAGCDTEE